jgi:hypothetical protein
MHKFQFVRTIAISSTLLMAISPSVLAQPSATAFVRRQANRAKAKPQRFEDIPVVEIASLPSEIQQPSPRPPQTVMASMPIELDEYTTITKYTNITDETRGDGPIEAAPNQPASTNKVSVSTDPVSPDSDSTASVSNDSVSPGADPSSDRRLWWQDYIANSILGRETVPISSNTLAIETLQHSPQVTVLAARPQAARTAILEETARFDWSAFVESRWRDISEPTGSTLTTGAANVFRDHQFTNEAGLRKTNRLGGELSVGQLFGLQRTNSQFFFPTDQGSSTFTIDYSQPLLRGAGRFVNESTIVLARLASDSEDLNFVAQIQDFLTDVNTNYWELYFNRAALLIERRLYNRALSTIDLLKKRENVDASKEMINRARSSLALRKTRLIEARRRLLDQQTLLRNIVNSPALDQPSTREFLPMDSPKVKMRIQ